ncbi:MAG TPA: phosphatase PAP2-related protein [Cyclobacteriaceae bacterium]|jgi:hypothetical protein|nr:phosphatase PAP2-related protein [Cyclobacteriaceae bacterium]
MWALWRDALQNKRFLFHFIVGLIGLIAFALFLPYFFIEILLPKPGEPWVDPVLNFFTPKDWSTEIFILIYVCSVLGIAFNITEPKTILLGLQLYVVVNFMRIASLYVFTLEAPEGIIPLSDPFLTVFAYGQPIYVKDLFFSGHISTLCVFLFIEKRPWLKTLIFTSTVVVATLLAWQRVHYTLDMVAAPLITWGVHGFFKWFDAKYVYR